jgi:hypothetical protein
MTAAGMPSAASVIGVLLMVVSVRVMGAPVSADGWGAGGVARSTPKSPVVAGGGFSAGEPVRQHPGELDTADTCRRSRTAQRQPSLGAARAQTGEPAGRGLTATGPGRPHLASC